MILQYCSDLHIERFPPGTPFDWFVKPAAPVLVIAGDICPVLHPLYEQFLYWCSKNWATVVLITGNHEYFCEQETAKSYDEIDEIVDKTCKKYRIHFLQAGQNIVLPGTNVRIVGATLWSAIDPAVWNLVEQKKGEYSQTYHRTHNVLRKTTASDICTLHALHKVKLLSAINGNTNETLVVVTHHMPTMKLLERRYQTDVFRTCYASADDELFSNVSAWICGHGHRAIQYKMTGGPLFLMNARGYQSEVGRLTDVYNPQARVQIKGATSNGFQKN